MTRIVYTCLSAPIADSPRTLYEAMVARGVDAAHAWLCTEGTQGLLPPGVESAQLGTAESVRLLESKGAGCT